LKKKWPTEIADIDKFSDAEILKVYPNSIKEYKAKTSPVEVDWE